jgi:hypothetical protein
MVISFGGPIAMIGVIAYVLVAHGGDIGRAADRASAATLIGVTALALAALVARSEIVVSCLTAMGDRPRRDDMYAANSFAFVVSTISHYLASPVRAGLLRRLDPERAPTIPQMVLVDGSTYLIEGLLAALLVIVSATTLKLAWWMVVLTVAAALAALGVALAIRRRFGHLPIFRGLAILVHSRQRVVVVGLTVVVFACQIARTLIVLRATGLHPSLLQAAATFVAGGVLSALLAGPTAGAAGAPLIVFGHRSIAAAAASGLILSISQLLAALLWALPGGTIYLLRIRARARGAETATSGTAAAP